MQVFVTGTDTDVGKTVIASWLTAHLKAYYWKPIESYSDNRDSDYEIVKKLSNLRDDKIIPCDYSFKTPVSPHLAAKIENRCIDMETLAVPNIAPLVIEGAGGVMVPINDDYKIIDLIQKFNIATIIVARSGLGTINHTCLTIEALRNRNIPILGIIMNGKKNQDNKEAIEKYGKVKVLSEFEPLTKLNFESLKNIPLPQAILEYT
jgi:dethiobiotin synthetase